MNRRFSACLCCWIAAAFLLFSNASAQTATSGSISGTVTDASGAVVPQADVELVNTETNAVPSQRTNAAGQYVFSNVTPGTYKLTFKIAGFRTASIPSVTVEVNRSINLPAQLEVGSDTQVVEVVAAHGAQLETSDAQIGNSISSDLISRLPTLQRNVTELMNLQPGVVPTGGGLSSCTTGPSTIGGDITQLSTATPRRSLTTYFRPSTAS